VNQGVDGVAALISDLHWQIDQLPRRGIKNSAGHPYNPSYYKRGLDRAIALGGLAVPQYIRRYLYKPPSDGYHKLEDADSLDLACEALVADEQKVYAYLFDDADREAARRRLAPHQAAIDRRKTAMRQRISARGSELPDDLTALRELAAATEAPDQAIAINERILRQTPDDIVALNRLGRAYEAVGSIDEARKTFNAVIASDPENRVATRRLLNLRAGE